MAHHVNQMHQHSCTTSIATNSVEGYKSPKHKLVRFFEKSRNQWKTKCLNGKAVIKRLQHRIRFLEKSKDRLKHRVSELEADLNTLTRLLQAKNHELEQLKKKLLRHPSSSIKRLMHSVSASPGTPIVWDMSCGLSPWCSKLRAACGVRLRQWR
jgi:chromosome segregation ATPase